MSRRKRQVVCIEDKMLFGSIAKASMYYDIHPSHLGKVCRGTRKTGRIYKKTFCFKEDFKGSIEREHVSVRKDY